MTLALSPQVACFPPFRRFADRANGFVGDFASKVAVVPFVHGGQDRGHGGPVKAGRSYIVGDSRGGVPHHGRRRDPAPRPERLQPGAAAASYDAHDATGWFPRAEPIPISVSIDRKKVSDLVLDNLRDQGQAMTANAGSGTCPRR